MVTNLESAVEDRLSPFGQLVKRLFDMGGTLRGRKSMKKSAKVIFLIKWSIYVYEGYVDNYTSGLACTKVCVDEADPIDDLSNPVMHSAWVKNECTGEYGMGEYFSGEWNKKCPSGYSPW